MLSPRNSPGRSVLSSVVFLSTFLSFSDIAAEPSTQAERNGAITTRFERSIDTLFAEGYPQKLEEYFCSLGDNPDLGFRLAGSPAEHATSERVAAEMCAMGLQNVRLESVPVDAYEFKHASLTVAGRTMTASTLDGTRPTPPAGITATLVYAKSGTAADFDAIGDVTGKLVLVDKRMSSWWFTAPGLEAARRGATGVICTGIPEDPLFYSINDQALGSFASYDPQAAPWIYVAQRDGDWLKEQLKSAPVTAHMILDATIKPMDAGGTGYNVIGELPGTSDDGALVVLVAHQDAHFRAGLDDTGALVNMLTIAKAMAGSSYRPEHTVVFLATTSEEYGRLDAYYDWAIGAWWAATRAHTDWPGRVRILINLEYMAFTGAPLHVHSDAHLQPTIDQIFAEREDLQPSGRFSRPRASTWTDQWTFSAAGVPSINVITNNPDYFHKVYHTQFETAELVDWPYLAQIAKFVFAIAHRFDAGIVPHHLGALCDFLKSKSPADLLTQAGADPEAIARLHAAADALRQAALDFEALASRLPAEKVATANRRLLAVERELAPRLAAFSPRFDEATIFPHEELNWDGHSILEAIAALKTAPANPDAAMKALTKSPLTRIGLNFSAPVYARELEKRSPGFARLHWGEQGQLPQPLDLVPACRKIRAGDFTGAISELEARRVDLVAELDARLGRMAAALEHAARLLEAPLT